MKSLIIKAISGIALSALVGTSAYAQSPTLDRIKEAGVIKVGVKTDYRPFGFLDTTGKVIGLEPDLAQNLADELGVKLELVPVQTANRIEFLQQGRIDLMIATLSSNEQRQRVLGLVEPYYYAGGTAVLLPKSTTVTSWADLRDKSICGTQGAYYNRSVAQKYGAKIVAFPGSSEAQSALLTGSCEGFLQDSTLLSAMLADPSARWADYTMPLPVEDWQVWAIAVNKSEEGGAFAQFVSDNVAKWHKTGYLIKKEAEWGLSPSSFLQDQHDKLSKK